MRKWKAHGKKITSVFNQNGAARSHGWNVCWGQEEQGKEVCPLLFSKYKHQRSLWHHLLSFLSFSPLSLSISTPDHPASFRIQRFYTMDYRNSLAYHKKKKWYFPQIRSQLGPRSRVQTWCFSPLPGCSLSITSQSTRYSIFKSSSLIHFSTAGPTVHLLLGILKVFLHLLEWRQRNTFWMFMDIWRVRAFYSQRKGNLVVSFQANWIVVLLQQAHLEFTCRACAL